MRRPFRYYDRTMSNVFYLRPADRKPPPAAAKPESLPLRVALTRVQLAAVICRSSTSRGGKPPMDVEAMARKLAADRARQLPSAPFQRHGAVAAPSSAAIGGSTHLPSNAFTAADVFAGRIKIDPAVSQSDLGRSLLRLRAEYIGVPDEVLVARQERTGAVAFSISDLDRLGDLVSGVIGSQRHMIENWASQGGRPGIKFRYQAPGPFGRVVHVGASEATNLRAIGVQVVNDRAGPDGFYIVDLALTQR